VVSTDTVALSAELRSLDISAEIPYPNNGGLVRRALSAAAKERRHRY
jgi:hypothetical protein